MTHLQIYDKLKAVNDEDILLHFPKRYDDLALTDLSASFIDKQKAVILGRPARILSIQGGRIIRITILSQDNKEVTGVIFSQPFYAHILKSINTYYFFGNYNAKQKALMLSLVLSKDSILVLNRYKPYYALPHEISQVAFYSLVLSILEKHHDYINEVLPENLREKYRLEDRLAAFKDVHVPVSKEIIERGLRVFKYEEALKYCLYSLYEKKIASSIKKKEMQAIDKQKINHFILSLSYKLTADQTQAVREIILDMDKPTVMNRLLEGDVGTGKTIVAFICMYANYLRGGQSVLLAPTLTLAEQHYTRAKKTFEPYGIKVVLLDNSLSPKQVQEAKESIQDGTAAIIIGTHFVFSDSIVYQNLTFAIADEQHKFGVEQRQALVNKGQGVDFLMMTATPIPRTLSMIINSDVDVSSLHMFPNEKRKVTTQIVSASDPLIDKAIKRALEVHKQVFIVAPKIEQSEASSRLSAKAVYEDMKQKYGEENVALLTGQVKKNGQQQIYKDFAQGNKLILVSTSLIEVGVDVTNAALMIIYEANYFGLASLHQLRGRIGRSGEGAMALLVYDGDDQDARAKLQYLADHDDGEEIALYDLSDRGSGEVFGEKQSGEDSLQVASFVKDFKVFQCAQLDAQEILSRLSIPAYKSYLDYVLAQKQKEDQG